MSTIICGFSGIGKSTTEQNNKIIQTSKRILDFESSNYSHFPRCGVRNIDFPKNYIDRLEKLIENNEADYYLLSCHEEVRNELKARGLKYIIVMPYRDKECKNEYKKRWLKRGSDINFIIKMNKRWNEMIDSCVNDEAPKIYLDEHEYLSDILTI